jgi:hypothetical protein
MKESAASSLLHKTQAKPARAAVLDKVKFGPRLCNVIGVDVIMAWRGKQFGGFMDT